MRGETGEGGPNGSRCGLRKDEGTRERARKRAKRAEGPWREGRRDREREREREKEEGDPKEKAC